MKDDQYWRRPSFHPRLTDVFRVLFAALKILYRNSLKVSNNHNSPMRGYSCYTTDSQRAQQQRYMLLFWAIHEAKKEKKKEKSLGVVTEKKATLYCCLNQKDLSSGWHQSFICICFLASGWCFRKGYCCTRLFKFWDIFGWDSCFFSDVLPRIIIRWQFAQ